MAPNSNMSQCEILILVLNSILTSIPISKWGNYLIQYRNQYQLISSVWFKINININMPTRKKTKSKSKSKPIFSIWNREWIRNQCFSLDPGSRMASERSQAVPNGPRAVTSGPEQSRAVPEGCGAATHFVYPVNSLSVGCKCAWRLLFQMMFIFE